MPCCSEHRTELNHGAVQFLPGLDQADTGLTIAYTEVPAEQRENIDLMRQLIQKFRMESPHAQAPQWGALRMVIEQKILPYIPCPYCRRREEYRLLGAVFEAVEAERGHYWHMTRLILRNEFKGNFWLLAALWVRKLRPNLFAVFRKKSMQPLP